MSNEKLSATWGLLFSALALIVIFRVLVEFQDPAKTPRIESPAEVAKVDPVCLGVKSAQQLAVYTDTRQNVAVSYTTRTGSTLIVNVMITNTDTRPHLMPSFHLADSEGCVHARSGARVDDEIRVLQRINPGMTVRGNVPFDVPEDNQYALMIDGSKFIRVEELRR